MILDSVLKELGHCFDSSDCELLGSAQACNPFVSHSVFDSATNHWFHITASPARPLAGQCAPCGCVSHGGDTGA